MTESPGTPTSKPVRLLDTDEEATLRTCFPLQVFALEKLEQLPQAAICRGKLRVSSEVAYETIAANVKERFGGRFFVLFQESFTGQPYFALVPNPQAGKPDTTGAKSGFPIYTTAIQVLLFLATAVCLMIVGSVLMNLFRGLPTNHPISLAAGIPYAGALLTIILSRDISRWLMSRLHRTAAIQYFLLPFPLFPGTLGTVWQLRAPIPHRKASFDFGASSSVAGAIAAIVFFLMGLSLSTIVPLDATAEIFDFKTLNPRFSILISALCKWGLGATFTAANAINLHPLAIAGYLGILLLTFNLMPLRKFDGGLMARAVFGQRGSMLYSQLAKFVLVILGGLRYYQSNGSQSDLIWIAIILCLYPTIDEPALNDVSEIDDRRYYLGLLAIFAFFTLILPPPRFVLSWLGI
jgi:membrane-associated protease RseP (regulator of RpoE activity)